MIKVKIRAQRARPRSLIGSLTWLPLEGARIN